VNAPNSVSLCSLAGRYDNPIPTRFLAPIDCLIIPARPWDGNLHGVISFTLMPIIIFAPNSFTNRTAVYLQVKHKKNGWFVSWMLVKNVMVGGGETTADVDS
jgi:hypothetical protein